MTTLFNDQFAPITSSVGFLEVPLEQLSSAMQQWRRTLGRKTHVRTLTEAFPESLHRLEPLTTHMVTREVVLETDSTWCAYFNNAANGTDAQSVVGYMSRTLKCQGVLVTCVPNTLTSSRRGSVGRYGAVIFQLLGPERTDFLNHVRAITAMNDGGRWIFEASGAVQEFERPECYEARRIADRFTPAMLADYCAALGIRLFEAAFYGPGAVLLEHLDRLPPDAETYTLRQAQQRFGIVASG